MANAKPWDKYFSEEATLFDADALSEQTIPQMLDRAVAKYANKPVLTTILPTGADTTVTYAELKEHATDFAIYLREDLKLEAGDTVAIMSPNCIGFCVASLGISLAGCIGTNVNPLYNAQRT